MCIQRSNAAIDLCTNMPPLWSPWYPPPSSQLPTSPSASHGHRLTAHSRLALVVARRPRRCRLAPTPVRRRTPFRRSGPTLLGGRRPASALLQPVGAGVGKQVSPPPCFNQRPEQGARRSQEPKRRRPRLPSPSHAPKAEEPIGSMMTEVPSPTNSSDGGGEEGEWRRRP
jgi:hypothetical protein